MKPILIAIFLVGLGINNCWSQQDVYPSEIRIYPNPVVSEFNIQNGLGINKVILFNVLGREIKIFEQVSENQIFHISEIPRGLYWVQLLDKENKIISTKRISKR